MSGKFKLFTELATILFYLCMYFELLRLTVWNNARVDFIVYIEYFNYSQNDLYVKYK